MDGTKNKMRVGVADGTYRVACRGCHGGCVHFLAVSDGQVTEVRPDPDAPLNRGHICPKGASVVEQMYHPDRLRYPMRRKGERGSGQWERISWDEAYDIIEEKLSAIREVYGAEAVCFLHGTGRHHNQYLRRFANVFGSPNLLSSGCVVCLAPRQFSGMITAGEFAGVDYYGVVKPAGILVWGANPAVSGADGELQWHIREAAANGTKLIVVDPFPTELNRKADLWLRLRPGTDGALAMGLLHVLMEEELCNQDFVANYSFGYDELRERCKAYPPQRTAEITDVPAQDIIRAARMLATIKPFSLEWGCAMEHNINAFQTCRAIFMLPLLTGNYDIPGGFVPDMRLLPPPNNLPHRLSQEQRNKVLSGGYPFGSGALAPQLRTHPQALFDAIELEKPYPVRALMVHANNTLLSMPDSNRVYQALKKLDFMVYMDLFMTPTAQLADLVLPAAFWPEVDHIFAMPEFAEQTVLCQHKLVQVGECKTDEDFYIELSQRMGLDFGCTSVGEVMGEQLDELKRRYPQFSDIDLETLAEKGYIGPERRYGRYLAEGFKTPSGRCELFSRRLEKLGIDPLPYYEEPPESPVSNPALAAEYPLTLTTGGRTQPYFISNNRQIRSLRRMHPFPLVRLHPDTALAHGILEGDWVWIETPRGCITQKAKLEPLQSPSVVNCELGWWYPEAGPPDYGWNESNANILTVMSAPHDPVMGSYQLRALLCRIRKNTECTIEERYFRSHYYE